MLLYKVSTKMLKKFLMIGIEVIYIFLFSTVNSNCVIKKYIHSKLSKHCPTTTLGHLSEVLGLYFFLLCFSKKFCW